MSDWDFFLGPYSGDARGLKIGVHLERSVEGGEVQFRFWVEGSGVRHAAFGAGTRRDELWKTTCFELFLARPDSPAYFEVNLATSGDWNVYEFDSYREGMRQATDVKQSPLQGVRSSSDGIEVTGGFSLEDFPGLLVGPVVLGATAVVEYLDGTKDYWALAHKGDKPDFHVRESFVANI